MNKGVHRLFAILTMPLLMLDPLDSLTLVVVSMILMWDPMWTHLMFSDVSWYAMNSYMHCNGDFVLCNAICVYSVVISDTC